MADQVVSPSTTVTIESIGRPVVADHCQRSFEITNSLFGGDFEAKSAQNARR
jgi:hypothetical protein